MIVNGHKSSPLYINDHSQEVSACTTVGHLEKSRLGHSVLSQTFFSLFRNFSFWKVFSKVLTMFLSLKDNDTSSWFGGSFSM